MDEEMVTVRSDRATASAPLVSFVVPTFNYAHFLPEAIASIVGQKGAPFEVIVVDDGSTDNPRGAVAAFPQVRLLRQSNRGLPASRNAGAAAARGTFLVFVDADDRLLPGALETWLELFAERPECGFVHGAYRSVDASWTPIWEPEPFAIHENGYELLLSKGNLIGCPATVMYRKDRLLEVGGFDERLAANEDYDLYLRMLQRFPVALSDQIVAEYRYHQSNMSGDTRRMLVTGREVVERQRQFAAGNASHRRAHGEGLANIQRYWIRAQLREARRGLSQAGGRTAALRNSLRLVPAAPALFLRECAAVAGDLLRRRNVRQVRWGSLRNTRPLSRDFGYDRGTPVDRRYIERFLEQHRSDIQGRVLEIKDAGYTRQFGAERVTQSDVLDIDADNPNATIVADLNAIDAIPANSFDCILLTQTLQLIYDFRTALRSALAGLKPGGVLLLTVPGITQIAHRSLGSTWYWSFTRASMRRLLGDELPNGDVRVEAHGNVLAAVALLEGIAQQELTEHELSIRDLDYQLIVTVRAVKPVSPA